MKRIPQTQPEEAKLASMAVEEEMFTEEGEEEGTKNAAVESQEKEGGPDEVGDEKDDDDDYYEYDDDDEEDEEVWYDSTSKPEPQRVIPLPDRLIVTVLDKNDLSSAVGTFTLKSSVFGLPEVRVDLLKRVVQYQRNKKRGKRYPAVTKTISQVSGSGRKIRKQKGMGMARVGHRRPPHFRGGAKAHGPKGDVQDYTTKLNKHTRRLGLVHALTQKLYEGNLIVVNDWKLESYRTSNLSKSLRAVGIGGKQGSSAYMLDWIDDDDDSDTVYNNMPLRMSVAASNIPRVKLAPQMAANVYDIIKHEKLVLTLGAIQGLEDRLDHIAY